MKKNENGFSIIHGLLGILVIGIVGCIGWYVWQSNNKKAPLSTTKTTSGSKIQKSNSKTELKIPDDWVEHKYERLGISLRAPEEWDIEELDQVEQLGLDAPDTVTTQTSGGGTERFRFILNIASPSANDPDKVQQATAILSSTELPTTNLFRGMFLTLNSSADSVDGPGVDNFSLTGAKYSTKDKGYKPVVVINNKSYEVWGGIFYDNDSSEMQPRLTLEDFNKLEDYKTAQIILGSIKSL